MDIAKQTKALSRFPQILLAFLMISVACLCWPVHIRAENETCSSNRPTAVLDSDTAINIAREYLGIVTTDDYIIKVEEKVITADTYNAFKTLKPGTNRLCWVVSLIVTDAAGAGKTVYVDQKSGEILGGYSSK